MPSFASARSISSASKPTFKPVVYRLSTSTTDPTNSTWRSSYAPKYSFVQGKGLVVRNQNISIMYEMFRDNETFNDPGLLDWEVSSVTNMNAMFSNATAFNQDISNWDVSSVTDMGSIFSSASSFNQDLRWWNVSNIAAEPSNFSSSSALTAANKPLWGQPYNYYPLTNTSTDPTHSEWRSNYAPAGGYKFKPNDGIYTLPGEPITDMRYMFWGNSTFNDSDIGSWDTSSVTTMYSMFVYAAFNQDISNWDVSSVTDMGNMFYSSAFNQDISNWDVSSVIHMVRMFEWGGFNQDLRWWDVSHIAAEPTGFGGASGWTTKPLWGQTHNYYPLTSTATDPTYHYWQDNNTPVGGYRFKPNDGIYTLAIEPITNMNSMFKFNSTFNDPDVSSWDTSSVTNMNSMFYEANAFNQDISSWDVSSVTNMDYMFLDTYEFNQDLTGWDVSNVTSYVDFSLGANSSWTLKPVGEKTITSSFSVVFTGVVSPQSHQNRYVDIVLFHPSDLGAGGAALTIDPAMALLADEVISLELTSTSFTQPAINNMSQNVLLENPFNANYTTYYSLQNYQQMSEAITYTGDLLPYTNFSNTNNATTGGDYKIRIRCSTNSYSTFLVGAPPMQTQLYDHRTIEFTGNYSLTVSSSF